jgi:hypothetical protein
MSPVSPSSYYKVPVARLLEAGASRLIEHEPCPGAIMAEKDYVDEVSYNIIYFCRHLPLGIDLFQVFTDIGQDLMVGILFHDPF